MKILVIGSGGREHAIVWKLLQSPLVSKIYCAPGNAGIGEYAECLEIKADNLSSLLEIAREKKIDCTIVGPEIPLSLGIADLFEEKGYPVFGPRRNAAEIESSKVFAKKIMNKYNIPTARSEVFDDYNKAIPYVKNHSFPLVIKADGLASGKGVIIVDSIYEAEEALTFIMKEKAFGDAGKLVLVEEYLIGEEISMLAFSDGRNIVPMVTSQDHKKIDDNDMGPNTGGMGAYSPVPFFGEEEQNAIVTKIFKPTITGLEREGRVFKGVLYAGLIITEEGPKVLEFNARFGDPETQVILPGLQTDLMEIIQATMNGSLNQIKPVWSKQSTVCVVMASKGYPGAYEQGKIITGLERLKERKDIVAFHSGTKKDNNKIISNGGRVIGITAWADKLAEAIDKAYQGVEEIEFENSYYRKDIGRKGLYFLEGLN